MKSSLKTAAISLLIIISVLPLVFSQNSDSSAATLNIINTPPAINSHLIKPLAIINGSSAELKINATDEGFIDSKYAIIRLPNGSRIRETLPNNFTSTRTGRHNVTFFANDTQGALSNVSDYFVVTRPLRLNLSVINFNSTGISSKIIYAVRNITNSFNLSSTGLFTNTVLANVKYDISILSYSNKTNVTLKGVNLSLNRNAAFGIDKLKTFPDTQIVTYGINNTFSITSAVVTISYSNLSYSSENNLVFVKCDNWNFKSESCSGSFAVRSDAVKDTSKHAFTLNTTTFSGFGIRDTGVSNGGGTTTGFSSSGGTGGSPSENVFQIQNPLQKIIEEGPAFNPNYRRFPVGVLGIPTQGILFGPTLIQSGILGKILSILILLILAFVLGNWVNSRTISVSSKDGEFIIKNNSLFKKELSSIFVVSMLEKIPKEAAITFGDRMYSITSFNGDVKLFFRNAVSSGPIMTNIGNKVIFAIKDNEGDFLNLFRNDEVKLKCEGISADNSKIYSINKKHIVDKSIQESLWKMLERKEISNPLEYFKDLMKAARKANLRNADDLKDYASNIVKILQ